MLRARDCKLYRVSKFIMELIKKLLTFRTACISSVLHNECLRNAGHNWRRWLENIRNRETKILRKILNPKMKDKAMRLGPDKELYQQRNEEEKIAVLSVFNDNGQRQAEGSVNCCTDIVLA